jgi:DNA-binding response OmpR family regulator
MCPTVAGVRLLVVEDEIGISTSLKRGFEADGFAVDVASNGTDGLWLARNNPYAVIVLDIMLPGVNGYEVCRRLRADGDDTPILMLTAKDDDLDQAEGLDTGADDYVVKPFSYVVLLARIRALIRRAQQVPASPVLEVGDLRLDPAAHRVWRGHDPVELSPRAMAVLEYLMREAGNVVSKDSILANVWDHAFVGDPNIVEVYISRIRQAIDSPYGRRALETVRGVGYRLDSAGG